MNRLIVTVLVILSLFCSVVSAGFYAKDAPVVNLDDNNFDKVLVSDDLWIVEFYAPWCGHCKTLIPDYMKAANALKGHVMVGAVDATVAKGLAQTYEVKGYPTIKVFGKDKANPTDYKGASNANAIIGAARRELKRMNGKVIPKLEGEAAPSGDGGDYGFYKGTEVEVLTDDTFDSDVLGGTEPWLVEFYAPWCGHCKTLAPEWKQAASELSGVMKIGAVDATRYGRHSDMFEVKGYPTIMFFAPGSSEPEDYTGGRTAQDIVKYSLAKAAKYPSNAVVNVEQLADQEAFEECTNGKTVCGVFITPHVIDTGAEGRNKMIQMFGTVARKTRFKGINFGWIVGGEHKSFEEALNIHTNYPAFAVIGEKKMVFATLKRAFTEETIIGMLTDMFIGKVPMRQLKELPKLSKNVPLWDGKDYVTEEEEI